MCNRATRLHYKDLLSKMDVMTTQNKRLLAKICFQYFQERSCNGKNKMQNKNTMLYGVNTSFKSVYLPNAKKQWFLYYLEKTKYDHTMMMTQYDDDGDASL